MTTEKNKKSVCSECIKVSGGCCVGVRFNVHVDEAKAFIEVEKNGGFPPNHKFILDKDDKEQYLYESGDEKCIHLDENNNCGIYNERPLICRMYPILWKKEENYYVDMICPLVHFIPLRDIALWPEDPQNQKMMKHMDELDFDGRSRQYINLKTLRGMNDALDIVKDRNLRV